MSEHLTNVPDRSVRQLRVVVEVHDYDQAVAFYRDVLGMPEHAAYAEGGDDDRVVILDAGRATLELATPSHKQAIDRVEAEGRPSTRVRLALEVADAPAATEASARAGATVIAAPVLTPWRSVNARLQAPGDLEITLFHETEDVHVRQQRPGFAHGAATDPTSG